MKDQSVKQLTELTRVINNSPEFFEEQADMMWRMSVALVLKGFTTDQATQIIAGGGMIKIG